MAITLVGTASGAGASVTATTASVTVPTGSTGDLLLIGVGASDSAATNTDAPLITSSSGALTKLSEFANTGVAAAWFYRFVQAGDASSYTFTLSSGAPETIVCARYSGVSSLRFWAKHGTTGFGATNVTSLAFPPVGDVASTDMVVVFAAEGNGVKATTIATISTPSGWTQRVTRTGPLPGTATAFPVTAAMYDKTAATDQPTVSGNSGKWAIFNAVLVDSANPSPDAPAGTMSFVNATTAAVASAGAASLAINKPSGVVDGDVMLLAVASSFLGVDTAPAGWIELTDMAGGYSHGTASNSYDVKTTFWYKVASSEGSSYTITLTTTQVTAAAIVAYRGVRSAAPVGMIGESVTNSTGATTTSPAPYTIPNVLSSHLIINFYTSGSDTNPGTSSVTGPSGTWTQRAQVSTSVASNPSSSITIADKLGAVDYPTATAATIQAWALLSVALVGTPQLFRSPPRGPNYRR
jgi:hypothetical protein